VQLDQMCDQLLANPVIETYRFELEPLGVIV
jgi:phosphoribosylformylglycinamidine synthase subunit PurS